MKNIFILSISIISLLVLKLIAGDQISLEHQNEEHIVGAGFEDYEVGDIFKLSDWNGALNGGQYHIIFVDMSASW